MNSNKNNTLYDSEYFVNRHFNDTKRLLSFTQESNFISKYIENTGKICDVGCATGEFLVHIQWRGDMYGMEVNSEAINTAKGHGINFDKNILNQKDYFDIVIFRGTIQHLPNPILYIEKAYHSLKKGGVIVFTATPNANSIYYKLFNTLPMIHDRYNYYIPSDITLINILRNFEFELLDIEKPYLKSPYKSFIQDHCRFLIKLFFRTQHSFAFWGSTMNIIAKK